MPHTDFQEAIESLATEDRRYHPDAYQFLRESLDALLKRRKKARRDSTGHVSPAEFLDGFRLHALDQFGPMAITVLDYWGVRETEDVGQMVFNLVKAGVFGKTDEDSIEQFRGVFDFHQAFSAPFLPDQDSLNDRSGSEV